MNGYVENGHLVSTSFDTIRQAQMQLEALRRDGTTATAILQRIALCELLLTEITGIRASLAAHVNDARRTQTGGVETFCG